MKTEEFDDAIKRKLESINPAFSEKDIERVHKYTVANRSPFSILGSSRAFWTLMATGMLVTALITWKITSTYVQNKTAAELVKIQPSPTVTEPKQDVKIITKTDTVYLKENSKDKYVSSEIKPKGFAIKLFNKENQKPIQKPVSGNNSANNAFAYNAPVAEKNKNADLPDENTTSSKSPIASGEGKENNKNNNIETPVNNSAAVTATVPALKSPDTASIAANKEPLKKAIANKAPIHDYADEHKNSSDEKPLNLNFMVGAGGETTLGNLESGEGIFTKLFFNNRFSINVGLKLMNVNHQYYATDDDFLQTNGYPFDGVYAQNLVWRGRYQPKLYEEDNINFTYTLWQVPVSFEYYFPITHSFTISASVGTDIDVSCTNKLTYAYAEVHYSGLGNATDITKINNYAAVPINNTVGSVGFIYQFHHLVVQLSPYVTKQNINVWYKGNTEWYEGASLKAFYSF